MLKPSFLALFLILGVSPFVQSASKTQLPDVPEVLKAAKGTITDKKPEGLTLAVDSKTPLNAEQWDAITALHLRSCVVVGVGCSAGRCWHAASCDA